MGYDVPMEKPEKQQDNNKYVVDIEGLTKEDITLIEKFIDFIKNKNNIDNI